MGGTWAQGPLRGAGRGCRAHGARLPPQWIMDVLICNGLGIYCGMKTLEWLSLKTYKWQGLWNIPTYKYVSRAPCSRHTRHLHGSWRWPPRFPPGGVTDEGFASYGLCLGLDPGQPSQWPASASPI